MDPVSAMLADRAMKNDRDYTYFHPSEVGACPRCIALRLLAVEPTNRDITPETIIKFDNGHSMHHRWLTYFRRANILDTDRITQISEGTSAVSARHSKKTMLVGESGQVYPYRRKDYVWVVGKCKEPNPFTPVKDLQVGDEIYLMEIPFEYPPWHMGGNIDAILKIDGVRYACDIKSINDKGFWYLFYDEEEHGANNRPKVTKCHACGEHVKGWGSSMSAHLKTCHPSLVSPQKKHIVQLSAYMHALTETSLPTEYAIVLYENKNNQMVMEAPFVRDVATIGEITTQCSSIWEMTRRGEYPGLPSWAKPKWSKFPEFECLYCDYHDFCWGKENKNSGKGKARGFGKKT